MGKLCSLMLSDGRMFRGETLSDFSQAITGEVVFATAMTGYVEVLSDPSYFGQIIVFSNPHIGNYGVCSTDMQSGQIRVKGVVVRHLSKWSANYRSQLTLMDWLMKENVPVIFGVDTRAIICHVRDFGSPMGTMGVDSRYTPHELLHLAKAAPTMGGQRLSHQVATESVVNVQEAPRLKSNTTQNKSPFRVVVMDFGVKREILRFLSSMHHEVKLVPPSASADEIWQLKPDGLVLSNGPGDPSSEKYAIKTVKSFLGKMPIFGICLGHQILSLALGLSTYKLKFGHRGSNHAVRTASGSVLTTAQNHGFAVACDQPISGVEFDVNASDQSIEGFHIKDMAVISVQFHPEASPGPHDSVHYFDSFSNMIVEWKTKKTPTLSLASFAKGMEESVAFHRTSVPIS